MRSKVLNLLHSCHDQICQGIETFDGKERFLVDKWQRKQASGESGGGGETRILRSGAVFEQAGVNFSEVWGEMPAALAEKLGSNSTDLTFYATGLSLVIHPFSPQLPTVHANYRYIELGDNAWFGGGTDLTPYYFDDQDAIHFHKTLKDICDAHDQSYYIKFKEHCDRYFYLPHRAEARGVGGIFFDYIGRDKSIKLEDFYPLFEKLARSFLDCYLPILQRRRDFSWNEQQKDFQLIRRGRYVEFNLLHDRGTAFGLQTGGRTESILMSLPPNCRWHYCYNAQEGSQEQKLIEVLKNPKNWV